MTRSQSIALPIRAQSIKLPKLPPSVALLLAFKSFISGCGRPEQIRYSHDSSKSNRCVLQPARSTLFLSQSKYFTRSASAPDSAKMHHPLLPIFAVITSSMSVRRLSHILDGDHIPAFPSGAEQSAAHPYLAPQSYPALLSTASLR